MDKIFSTIMTNDAKVFDYFFVCLGVSLILGLALALSFMYRNRYSKSFVVTLAIIPAVVQLLIMIINGRIGAGIAVAGAFSLVKFRSAQGSAREIGYIFLATAIGVSVGTGYIGISVIFTVIMILVMLLFTLFRFGEINSAERELRITIPESLDYTNAFDDIFAEYTSSAVLVKVKTSNMGSLYRLSYRIVIKNALDEKRFIDELRVRNGNLEIVCSHSVDNMEDTL